MTTGLLNAGPSLRGWSWRDKVLSCPAAFHHSYNFPLRENPPVALIKGSLVHIGLAHHYTMLMCEQNGWTCDLMSPHDAIAELAWLEDREIGHGDSWATWVPLAQTAVSAYRAQHTREPIRVIAVEHPIEMWVDKVDGIWSFVEAPSDAGERRTAAINDPLGFASFGPPYLHTSRIDLLCQDLASRFLVIDHKTSSTRIDSRKKAGFDLSGQVLGLTRWGAESYGAAFGGFSINFVPLRSPYTTQIYEPQPAPYAMSQFPATIAWTEKLIALYHETGEWPLAIGEQTCMRRYGACDHAEKCRWGKLEEEI